MNEDYDTGEGPYEDFNAFEISVYELLERLYPDYDFSEYKGLCAALDDALNRTGETVAVDLSDVPHHIALAFYYAAKVRSCTEVCIDAIALAVERAVDNEEEPDIFDRMEDAAYSREQNGELVSEELFYVNSVKDKGRGRVPNKITIEPTLSGKNYVRVFLSQVYPAERFLKDGDDAKNE